MKKRTFSFVAAAFAPVVMMFAQPAWANTVVPGGTASPDIFASSDLGTYTGTSTGPANGDGLSLTEYVYLSGTGTYNYLYVPHTSTSTPITSISITNFSAVIPGPLDVGYCTSGANGCYNGSGVPSSVAWSADGNTVTFYYSSALTGSVNWVPLVIATPGTLDVKTGQFCDNNNSCSALNSLYDPGGSPTPLPAALPLFGTGLGVLGLALRRRKRKTAAA